MPSVLCPVLVGRRPEVEELDAAVAAVAEKRRGSTHFLIGEARVGKSRLAREALDMARRRRFNVLLGPGHTRWQPGRVPPLGRGAPLTVPKDPDGIATEFFSPGSQG